MDVLYVLHKMKTIVIHTISLILSLTGVLQAAPFRLEKSYSFEGKISSFLRVGATSFEYEGDNFMMLKSSTKPEYFIMVDAKEITKDDADQVSFMSGHVKSGLSHPFHNLKREKNQVMVYVPIDKIEGIKIGDPIKVKGYTGWGDESMSKVSWEELVINSTKFPSPK